MPVVVERHESAALRGNPLGDPHARDLHLIIPEGLDPGAPVPCVWYLSGYAGVSRAMLSHDPWQEGLEERLARLEREGAIGKMIVALPDAFTRFGGSQYLSSSAHGDYETYLWSELVGLVEQRYSISAHAVAGKSSGGYGALMAALRHPGRFAAVACHSGDMGFRLAYYPDLIRLMNAVHDHGGIEGFVAAFDRSIKKKDGKWLSPISIVALAAAYSPDPSKPFGVALPIDLERGDVDDAVFARWLELDPVTIVDRPDARDALRKLACLFVDCGRRDEYNLQWGARALAAKLRAHGVPHEYEEFDDGHRSIGYRLDTSLPKIWRALADL